MRRVRRSPRLELVYAAGTSTANTTLTALSPGAVEVSATLDGTQSTEGVRLAVIPVAASGIRSSESLIGEKRDAGQLTAEQALVYRVLATFGAAELPAEFRGNDLGKLDGGAVREATLQLENLSPAAQASDRQVPVSAHLFRELGTGAEGRQRAGQEFPRECGGRRGFLLRSAGRHAHRGDPSRLEGDSHREFQDLVSDRDRSPQCAAESLHGGRRAGRRAQRGGDHPAGLQQAAGRVRLGAPVRCAAALQRR